jgi:D-alanyl-D-alanine carboxypeptidase
MTVLLRFRRGRRPAHKQPARATASTQPIVRSALALAITLPLLAKPAHAAQLHAAQPGSWSSQDRFSSIVVDAGTGQVLSSVEPDAQRYPASLAKLMTLYMLFEALRDHRITLDQMVPVSAHAASMEPSKLGLLPGSRLTVEQGILGLVTKSANDAASALGEMLGGDETRFAAMMTLRAHALGMTHTTFRNASGLPDPEQVTTARDMAILARHIVEDFPADYAYFSVPSFVFHGQVVFNHDRMLIEYPGADGMKTGYTQAAGHNLVTSAMHGTVRLIGVILGAPSNPVRDMQMAGLLNAGFAQEGAPPAPMLVASRARFGLRSLAGLLVPRAEADTLTRHHADRTALSSWSVQLGTFGSERTARHVAASARAGADAGALHLAAIRLHGRRLWRVQLVGLSEHQATQACAAAARTHTACLAIRPAQVFARS